MSTQTIVRFAPSPTGRIHIGNARTALAELAVRAAQRRRPVHPALRRHRSRALARRIRRRHRSRSRLARRTTGSRLSPVRARSRSTTRRRAKLREMGRLYPCYETAEELDRRRKRQQALGRPPIYDRAALRLTAEERAALGGARPAPALALQAGADKSCAGAISCAARAISIALRFPIPCFSARTAPISTPCLRWSTTSTSASTHVIRGEDHVTNTAVQIQIFEALGGAAPAFGHHNLLTDATRRGPVQAHRLALDRLACARAASRRSPLRRWRCWSAPPNPCIRSARSTNSPQTFDLGQLSHAAARFDEAELRALSARTLHRRPSPPLRDRLAALGIEGPSPNRSGCRARQSDAAGRGCATGGRIVHGRVDAGRRGRRVSRAGRGAICPPEPWDASTWGVDGAAQAPDRPQGPGLVPSLAPGADGPRVRTGTRGAVAADRPR